jgi:GNAT superfamily N-acetyltransferase
MNVPSIHLSDAPTEEERRAIHEGLREFNAPFLGPPDHRALSVTARVAERLCGGLVGETGRGWLTVDLLWVSAAYRGQGLGSALLLAAEGEARRRHCRHARLSTYDFQAPSFYERHGYRLYASLDGFPNGHRSLFLRKAL